MTDTEVKFGSIPILENNSLTLNKLAYKDTSAIKAYFLSKKFNMLSQLCLFYWMMWIVLAIMQREQ